MKIEKYGNITLINGDCMEFMQSQSDKSFDLAIYKVKVQSKKKKYTPHKNQ